MASGAALALAVISMVRTNGSIDGPSATLAVIDSRSFCLSLSFGPMPQLQTRALDRSSILMSVYCSIAPQTLGCAVAHFTA